MSTQTKGQTDWIFVATGHDQCSLLNTFLVISQEHADSNKTSSKQDTKDEYITVHIQKVTVTS